MDQQSDTEDSGSGLFILGSAHSIHSKSSASLQVQQIMLKCGYLHYSQCNWKHITRVGRMKKDDGSTDSLSSKWTKIAGVVISYWYVKMQLA